MATVAELDSRCPPISNWEVHVLQPWAHVDDLKKSDDIGDYHRDTYADGKLMGTEWNPHLQEKMTQQLHVQWHRVLQRNYLEVLSSIPCKENTLLFNLCDGQEARGWVGYSVIRAMERLGFAFTGAPSHIYSLDETKAKMKKHLVAVRAATPSYLDLTDVSEENKDEIIAALGRLQMPVLVKPSESSSSVGLTDKSVCNCPEDAWRVALDISAKHGPVYVEEFIAGREYTVFVSGSAAFGVTPRLALERVFNKNLPSTEQFLSYETKWERWQSHWWYAPAPAEVQQRVKEAAVDTYVRAGCSGYCRFDLREDARDGKVYAVDVNVNCSLDVDDETALQILLSAEGIPMCALLEDLMRFAFRRREAEKLQLKSAHFGDSLSTHSKQPSNSELQPPKLRLEEGTD